jgi:CheY-like chemotaxis protein
MDASRPRAPVTATATPSVLVADDEPAVRALLRATLPLFGFRALLAADGEEALQLFRAHAADVSAALLDVFMPRRDGPATLAALRALAPGLPCVFMTAYSGDYDVGGLLALGADRVILKPFLLEDLVGILRRLCDRGG